MNEDRYVICLSITTRFRVVAIKTARTNKTLSSVSRNPELRFNINRLEKIKFEIQLVLNELDLDDFTIVCYDGNRSKSSIKILIV